jgi:xylose isomerase
MNSMSAPACLKASARRIGMTHVTGRHLCAHDIDLLPAGSETRQGFEYLRDMRQSLAAQEKSGEPKSGEPKSNEPKSGKKPTT